MGDSIPDLLIARFRALSLERVARIEGVWMSITQGAVDQASVREMSRDLHTLKGDASIVGFEEVALLAHKTEELVGLAGKTAFRVSEDLELVMTMALQFLGLLLKKKSASAMSGIDLVGFVRTVDEILNEAGAQPPSRRRDLDEGTRTVVDDMDRLSEATRGRLAVAATSVYLEYLAARGPTSRNRMRSVWRTLRDELGRLHTLALAPLFDRHADAARQLAGQLGKAVEIRHDAANVQVDARSYAALDVAILHLVRNAIDHGIESHGAVELSAREVDGALEIRVANDGRGIDVEAVRAKAIETGFATEDSLRARTDSDIVDLLFQPGFSTRHEVTETSGRGVGLDAVKNAIARIGGQVSLVTSAGAGTTVTLAMPSTTRQISVYRFLAPNGAVSLAVSARWSMSIVPFSTAALDPIGQLQMASSSRQTSAGSHDESLEELAIRFRWGFLDVLLRARSEPVLVTAERCCPTPDEHPLEVVLVGGHETLLVRPEHVAEMLARGVTSQAQT